MPETSSKNSAKDTQVYHTPSPLADGSPKRENEHHINRDHFQDGSSSIGIGHLMTGDDPQGGSSAVSEANRKEGGRPRPVNGPRESDQSGDTYEEPGTEVRTPMSPHQRIHNPVRWRFRLEHWVLCTYCPI